MTITEVMLRAIGAQVCGKDAALQCEMPADGLRSLYKLAKAHDVAHLVSAQLTTEGLITPGDEIGDKFRREQMLSVFRAEQQAHEQEQLYLALAEAKIPFIPLKGAVIRGIYPDPAMRTSCDIDVLVKAEDLQRAVQYTVDTLGYREQERGTHDVSMIAPSGVCVELHYALVEKCRANNCHLILAEVWDHACPTSYDPYCFALSDEMLYYYHIAHMAKHFENGGCGIRPFLDLWLLENRVEHDEKARRALLARGGLLRFAECCCALSQVWFEDAPHTPITLEMAQYLLRGGAYGNMENMVTVNRRKKGGKVRYVLSRLFLPYETLCLLYPVVRKHRLLAPVMQVRRWVTHFLRGRWKRSLKEIGINRTVSEEKQDRASTMLESVGLGGENNAK